MAMHAEKIRTADIPRFRLETKDALVLICFIGLAAYVIGFVVGLTY